MTQHGPLSRRSHARGAMLAALLSISGTASAAVPSPVVTDPRWLPWIGCWSPVTATSDVAPMLARTQRVCVMTVDGADGVDVVGVADGAVVSRMRVNATGERRPVSREGCEGWETARWSAAGGRVFLRSELTCAGGIERVSTGIIAIASPGEWVDVEVVSVRGQQSTRIVRYRSAPDSTALDRAISTALGDRELARRTARMGAAALPTIADVVEASREVDAAVVEAWLLQRMPRFAVDARQLRRLANARVPGSVIDLVVVLSSPEIFQERLATRSYTLVRLDAPRQAVVALEPQGAGADVVSSSITIQGGSYENRSRTSDRCDRCSREVDVIYYESAPYAPYGYYPYWPYGSYYPSYPYTPSYPYYPRPRPEPERPPQRPPVIVNGPSFPKPAPTWPTPEPEPEVKGRAVKGRGYTRTGSGSAAEPVAPVPPPQASPTSEPSQPRESMPRQAEPSQPREAAPRQAEPRQAEPRQAEPRQAEPRQAEPRPAPPPPAPPQPSEVRPAPAPAPAPTPPEPKPEPPPRTAKIRPPTS